MKPSNCYKFIEGDLFYLHFLQHHDEMMTTIKLQFSVFLMYIILMAIRNLCNIYICFKILNYSRALCIFDGTLCLQGINTSPKKSDTKYNLESIEVHLF